MHAVIIYFAYQFKYKYRCLKVKVTYALYLCCFQKPSANLFKKNLNIKPKKYKCPNS